MTAVESGTRLNVAFLQWNGSTNLGRINKRASTQGRFAAGPIAQRLINQGGTISGLSDTLFQFWLGWADRRAHSRLSGFEPHTLTHRILKPYVLNLEPTPSNYTSCLGIVSNSLRVLVADATDAAPGPAIGSCGVRGSPIRTDHALEFVAKTLNTEPSSRTTPPQGSASS